MKGTLVELLPDQKICLFQNVPGAICQREKCYAYISPQDIPGSEDIEPLHIEEGCKLMNCPEKGIIAKLLGGFMNDNR